MNRSYRIIISGGGTGGHLFPALSIADEIKQRFPVVDILFVGADNRMEMEHVPTAGYRIIGLPVSGLDRTNLLKNIGVVWRLLKSLRMARKIIRDFKPDIAIGVGGYASGPVLWMASSIHIPILIQEQNSYAGVTNRLLGKRAKKICVAYRGMEKYFPEERIIITGNPVRKELELLKDVALPFNDIPLPPFSSLRKETDYFLTSRNVVPQAKQTHYLNFNNKERSKAEALQYFGMESEKPVLLVLGGSLGARTINQSIRKGLEALMNAGIQVIWQTGRIAYTAIKDELNNNSGGSESIKGLWVSDFITRMDYAYLIADLVVSRAGACTLSELCLLMKATILVPSPNVADDHQTKNARALSENDAAVLIPDKDAVELLTPTVIELLTNNERLNRLSAHIALFAQHDSTKRIVDEVVKLLT